MNKKSLHVLSFLVVLLFGLEITLRFLQPSLSKDLKHYGEMRGLLDKYNNEKGEKVLFIGNSLTREGINKKLFKEQNRYITLICPDDTTITEWSWIFKNMVYNKTDVREINIIFAGSQLKDKKLEEQNLVSISNITDTKNIPDVIRFEALGISDIMTLVLAHSSVVFSSRERIQRRILDFLPKYREQTRLINQALVKKNISTKIEKQKSTYKHLNMLIKLATEKHIHIKFIAVPLPSFYHIDNDLINIFNKRLNVTFLDGRKAWNVKNGDFKDGYHLSSTGASKFTQFIIDNYRIGKEIQSAL